MTYMGQMILKLNQKALKVTQMKTVCQRMTMSSDVLQGGGGAPMELETKGITEAD